LKYKYLCIYVGGSNPLSSFVQKYFVTNSVDIKLSAHDAPPEQSALGTLKIERLDRQATQKFLESNTTKRCQTQKMENVAFIPRASSA
jgi:hypothetical protein